MCGDTAPSVITSPSNELFVGFYSDSGTSTGGYRILVGHGGKIQHLI